MKKEILKYVFIGIIVLLIFTFVYPTLYRYDKYDQRIPVRINRVTGKTELLNYDGWKLAAPTPISSIVPTETPMPAADVEPIETYNGETFEQFYERVLKETPGETFPKKNTLYYRWERARMGIVDKMIEPKDYFSKGSTNDEVRKVMGPPNSIEDDAGGSQRWEYETSSVTFVKGKVSWYDDPSNKLLVR